MEADKAPMLILRGGSVYTPTELGPCDVLIGGTHVLKISTTPLEFHQSPHLDVIDITDHFVLPGIVDVHVHASGNLIFLTPCVNFARWWR